MSAVTTAAPPTTEARTAVQVYRVYIKAPIEKVWEAITQPEWTERYFYESRVSFDLRPGGAYESVPSEAMKEHAKQAGYPVAPQMTDGEVLEVDPPRRLVQTWRLTMDDAMRAEGFTRLTWELEETRGVTRLTVSHDVTGASGIAGMVSGDDGTDGGGGGWAGILSGLKTLLETGDTLWS